MVPGALAVAMGNLKNTEASGMPVVMGTDTGPAMCFQGYFEHLELEYMDVLQMLFSQHDSASVTSLGPA
jgi:hypothetical protein